VQREATVKLDKGINRVVFLGVTKNLDPSSIQIKVGEGVTILSVSHRETILQNPKKAPIIKMLEDSVKHLETELLKENNNQFVFRQMEDVLMQNKSIKGDKGVNLIDLEDVIELYRTKLTQIKKGLLESESYTLRLHERIAVLKKQLEEFRSSNRQPVYEVIAVLSANNSRNEKISLGYYAHGAAWQPYYDIRVSDVVSPITLQYKAEVRNNTGENWDNVNLSLSTGNPNLSGYAPTLRPTYLIFQQENRLQEVAIRSYKEPKIRADNNGGQDFDASSSRDKYEGTKVVDNTTTVLFELATPVNVAANNQAQLLDISSHQVNGLFEHVSIPKLDPTAYLRAKVTGWEELNLLSGYANIFFEESFIGKTFINPELTVDTLFLSLGRDNRITVSREKLKNFTNKNLIGSKIRQQQVYEISVRNNKKETINIEIQDQIPLSIIKDIEVEEVEVSGGVWDKESGKVSWKKSIAPGETIKIRISLTIRYPKDKVVVGL
jgi:uncharacterized protein (TIGR02231 family)